MGPGCWRAPSWRDRGRGRTPIVALTGNAMAEQIAEVMRTGMDAHISKPIDVRTLFRVIAEMADRAMTLAKSGTPLGDEAPTSAQVA